MDRKACVCHRMNTPVEYDDTELKRQKYVEKKQKDFIAKMSYRRNKTKRRSK